MPTPILPFLFVASLVILAIVLRRGVDEWLANVRLRRMYATQTPRCFRCGANLDSGESRCLRCKSAHRVAGFEVVAHVGQWAMLPRIAARSYIHHTVRDPSGREARFVAPGNVTVRQGDKLRFVCDARGSLRALENVTLATGWRLPTRAVGERSPLASLGGLLAGPAVLALLFVMPIFFLMHTLEMYDSIGRTLTGDSANQSNAIETPPEFASMILWLTAALFAGAGLLGLRSRPAINRKFLATD